MDIRKSEFRVAGATQDATSAERCDLTQDPGTLVPATLLACSDCHFTQQMPTWKKQMQDDTDLPRSTASGGWTDTDTENKWIFGYIWYHSLDIEVSLDIWIYYPNGYTIQMDIWYHWIGMHVTGIDWGSGVTSRCQLGFLGDDARPAHGSCMLWDEPKAPRVVERLGTHIKS